MVNPLLQGRTANQDIYVRALTSAYRSGFRLFDPDLALARDPEIYDKVRRDPVVMHAMETRLHSVAGKRFRIEPNRQEHDADQKVAAIIEDMLKDLAGFTETRYELAMAVIFNRSYAMMHGTREPNQYGEDTAERDWWRPTWLQDIDRRRFRLAPVWIDTPAGEPSKLKTETQLWSVTRNDWFPVKHLEWFIRHVYGNEESRLGYGRGLLEAIFVFLYVKEIVLREGIQGLERWAQGFVVVKVDGARAASTLKPNDEIQSSWLEVIKKAKARHGIVADKNDEVELLQQSGTGHQQGMDLLHYLDNAIRSLVTGQVLATGGGEDAGSLARIEGEMDQAETLLQYDRTLLDETLTRDLIGLLWRMNRPQFQEAGLADAKMPRFTSAQERREDPEVAARVAKELLSGGVDLRADEVYRKTGYTPPAEGDDIIRGQVAAAAPAGFGGFSFGDMGAPAPGDASASEDMAAAKEGLAAGNEEVAAPGIEPPSMQELSLALERAVKNRDRATAELVRKKLWAVMGEDSAPDLTDEEWEAMTAGAPAEEGVAA